MEEDLNCWMSSTTMKRYGSWSNAIFLPFLQGILISLKTVNYLILVLMLVMG